MTDIDVVRLVADAWDTWSREDSFPFDPDHCVNGTRVAIEVLKCFDVPAHPVSVEFVLFNRFAKELFDSGVTDSADWPPHAWSLGVSEQRDEIRGEDRWNGHLVCEGLGWTLDVSARQFHRPGLIEIEGPWVIPENLPDNPAVGASYIDAHQQVLVIHRWPANNAWRRARGWKRLHAAERDEVVRRVLRTIEKGTP